MFTLLRRLLEEGAHRREVLVQRAVGHRMDEQARRAHRSKSCSRRLAQEWRRALGLQPHEAPHEVKGFVSPAPADLSCENHEACASAAKLCWPSISFMRFELSYKPPIIPS